MASLLEFWNLGPTLQASPFDIVVTNGQTFASQVRPNGDYWDKFGVASLITLPPDKNGLNIENYKQAWIVIAAALVLNDHDLLVKALKCVEFGLSFRNTSTVNGITYTGPIGSFPAVHNGSTSKNNRIHNKTIAMHSLIRILWQAKNSAFYVGADALWIDSLIAQMSEFTYWLADSDDVDKFFTFGADGEFAPANQLMSVACYLQLAGLLHGDPALTAQSYLRFQQIFDNAVQLEDKPAVGLTAPSMKGVFYEKLNKDGIGFDGNYMGFTLQNLADAAMTETDAAQKAKYMEMLEMGVRRWLQTMNLADGTISHTTQFLPGGPVTYFWTRVKETFPAIPGLDAKGWNYDGFTYRIQEFNYIFGNAVVPDNLANMVTNQGRCFGHIKGDPDNAVIYVVLTQAEIDQIKGTSAVADWAALTQVKRIGGGNCTFYPGGVLPNPSYIIPATVQSQFVHSAHAAFLASKPHIDVEAPGFPPPI